MAGEAIIIRGVGLCTPLGGDVESTWSAVLAGEHVVGPTARARLESPAIESRIAALGLVAMRQAMARVTTEPTALFVGTSKGPVDDWLRCWESLRDGQPWRGGEIGLHTLASSLAADLPAPPVVLHTSSAACASGLHAVARAYHWLRHTDARRAIVVAAESSLHPIFTASFKRLGVLCEDVPRPLDHDLSGFVIAEAAAAVLLEKDVPRPGDLILHWASTAGDATHLTGSSPDARTVSRLLADGHRAGGPFNLIHLHATGTALDAIELHAAQRYPRDGYQGRPAMYTHKGALGHSLGASGLVALVLSAQMHREEVILPMLTMCKPMYTPHNAVRRGSRRRLLTHSAVLASGFGGVAAIATLGSCTEVNREFWTHRSSDERLSTHRLLNRGFDRFESTGETVALSPPIRNAT